MQEDTIAAISTPGGTGGISIARVSGPEALAIASSVVKLRGKEQVCSMKSWSARLGAVVTPGGTVVDQVIVLVMKAPRSYTGEDVVEVQCHGGPVVSQKVLLAMLEAGARHAEPGEFTKRAFLNGRISLEEAESVLDVVTAPTEAALSQAGKRLRGELGSRVKAWEERLYSALASFQAATDFPEDIEGVTSEAYHEVDSIHGEICDVLDRAPLGLALANGINVCLVGAPNSGKSALFNSLISQDRAIVTEVPGTTRDVLRERTEWNGLPIVLLDTAGLRETSDIVEMIGVERAERAAAESEVILYVIDDTVGISAEDIRWLSGWAQAGRRVLVVTSKVDKEQELVNRDELANVSNGAFVMASSVTGKGIQEIKDLVTGWFDRGEGLEAIVPGSARQVDCLRRAASAIADARLRVSQGWSEDVLILSLEEAARALSELTGKNVSQETLEQIFSKFCVGK